MEQVQRTPAAEIFVQRQVEECEATDFNERLLAWIVECQISTDVFGAAIADEPPEVNTQTYRLNDASQEIEPVGP